MCYLTGPGYAPSGDTPYEWGEAQASYATTDYNMAQSAIDAYSNPFIFADIEVPGTYGRGGSGSDISQDQQVWEGCYEWLQGNKTNVGVYSDQNFWASIMGSQSWPVGQVEWTAATTHVDEPTPCLTGVFTGGPSGESAGFFGGDSEASANALVWQFSQGTYVSNPIDGDYDQSDITHYNDLFGGTYWNP